jgi:uncharacterized OB-fold protein
MSERAKTPRPLPKINRYTDTKPFWDAALDQRLLLQYCTDTGQAQWFPRSVSLQTGRRHLEWREASGNGTVYSFTITYRAWSGHEDRVPYVVALVELPEGVRILANLLHCEPEDVRIGLPVTVCWERLSDEINYPAFEPARPRPAL